MYDDQTEVPMINPNPGSWIWGSTPVPTARAMQKAGVEPARVL